jgi:pimeloyl-ACP methyl ester carboxylesterase
MTAATTVVPTRDVTMGDTFVRISGLPRHGASPAHTSRSYCLEDFVEDVARVFRELSIEKEDRVTPPQESEIPAKGISDSTLPLIPGAGHFSMLENPVAFNRILRRFLDGLRRRAS